MTDTRLTKHPGDRVWAGVCAGIARWLGVDPVLIRLVWLAWAVFGDTGTAFLAYIALLIVLPEASRDERREEAERRRLRHASSKPAKHDRTGYQAAPAVHAAPPPSAVATAPVMPAGGPTAASPTPPSPSPTADELGDVLLRLLDATAAVAVNVGRAAVLATRAAFVTGHATYRAKQRRQSDVRAGGAAPPAVAPAAPSPRAAGDAQPATSTTPGPSAPSASSTHSMSPPPPASTTTTIPTEPHIESDEERLHRQIRDRLDAQVAGARGVIGAAGPQAAARERTARRGRLRQLAGFGVLALGAWGLTATLGLEPLALTAAAIPTLASAAVVIAASLVCLGTYLLWTAVRRHP